MACIIIRKIPHLAKFMHCVEDWRGDCSPSWTWLLVLEKYIEPMMGCLIENEFPTSLRVGDFDLNCENPAHNALKKNQSCESPRVPIA
jgi:hypothetical protein